MLRFPSHSIQTRPWCRGGAPYPAAPSPARPGTPPCPPPRPGRYRPAGAAPPPRGTPGWAPCSRRCTRSSPPGSSPPGRWCGRGWRHKCRQVRRRTWPAPRRSWRGAACRWSAPAGTAPRRTSRRFPGAPGR